MGPSDKGNDVAKKREREDDAKPKKAQARKRRRKHPNDGVVRSTTFMEQPNRDDETNCVAAHFQALTKVQRELASLLLRHDANNTSKHRDWEWIYANSSDGLKAEIDSKRSRKTWASNKFNSLVTKHRKQLFHEFQAMLETRDQQYVKELEKKFDASVEARFSCCICRRSDHFMESCPVTKKSTDTQTPLHKAMLLPRHHRTRLKLSAYGYALTESIEFFEATEQDITKQSRNSKRIIKIADVGIRCAHCHRNANRASVSTSHRTGSSVLLFPRKWKTVPHNFYLLAKRHLIESCESIPPLLKRELVVSKNQSTSESGMKDGIGLPTFLQLVADKCGLINSEEAENGIQRYKPTNET